MGEKMSERLCKREVLIHLLEDGAVVATVVFLCAVAATAAESTKLAPLPDLPDLHLRLDPKSVVIVAPRTEKYQTIARTLAEGLHKHTSQAPRIVGDSTAPAELGPGPILVLGNLMDSQLARSLYFQAYDFTDYSWPSPGGCVVRTIRDPFNTEAHVVLLGGSDVEGVAKAARELIKIVDKGGSTLGYVNRVELGRWADEIKSYTERFLSEDEEVWSRSGEAGSWQYMMQISKAGLGYLRTADQSYLPVFKRELQWWADHDLRHPSDEAPQMIHGFLNTMLIVWDLLRDHPFFTPQERRKFDEDFLYAFRSHEGPGRIDGESKRTVVRNNHGTRTALDGFFGGRYFSRRYRLKEAERWLAIADRYFAVQMTSAKPVCDNWGHQFAASLYDTLVYAMAAGKEDYLRSSALKLAADRALIAQSNVETPPTYQGFRSLRGYLSACAVATDNSGYLSNWGQPEDLGRSAAKIYDRHGHECMRSFCTGAITRYKDLLGIAIAPVDRLWYETIDAAGFNRGELFLDDVPRDACFDKASIREGWAPEDYYLLLDGISGGHHAFQDANCIVRFCEAGLPWLSDSSNRNTSITVRVYNGVSVALDGAGAGRLHRYSRRLYAGRSGDYFAVAGSLEGVGNVDWQRHIVRKRGDWTLVIDRVSARKPGEVLVERHWHVLGDVTAQTDGLVSEQAYAGKHQYLHLKSAGIEAGNRSDSRHRMEVARFQAAHPGTDYEFATLLHVNSTLTQANKSAAGRDIRLTKTAVGWRIDSKSGAEFLMAEPSDGKHLVILREDGVTKIGERPVSLPSYAEALKAKPVPEGETLPVRPECATVSLPWREFQVDKHPVTAVARANDGRVAAGDAKGNVVLFHKDAGKTFQAKFGSPILSLHFVGQDLVVGEDRGTLTRLAYDGTQRWQVEIPYRPMAWPYWSEECSRVREITSADINDDGKEEILISNSDRRVYAFTGEGNQLWKASVQWGVYTAMTAGEYGDAFALYGGTSQPAVTASCMLYGSAGKVLRRYNRPDIGTFNTPSQFRDVRLVDVAGNGKSEVLCAVDTNCRQLVVYQQSDGRVLWDADVGGAAETLAVDREGEAAVVYCASSAGYVSCFDGPTGARRWASFIGEPAPFVAPYGSGQVLAVARSGRVWLLDDQGDIVGCQDLGCPITGLLRPGDHRAGNAILVGTRAGRLLLLAKTNK